MEFLEAISKLNALGHAMQGGEGIAAELRLALSPGRRRLFWGAPRAA